MLFWQAYCLLLLRQTLFAPASQNKKSSVHHPGLSLVKLFFITAILDKTQAHNLLGFMYLQKGDYDKARTHLE